jgi:hypothetical protein
MWIRWWRSGTSRLVLSIHGQGPHDGERSGPRPSRRLGKSAKGVEVVVERDDRPVAVIGLPFPQGRLLSECIALAEARGTSAIPDEGFMKDVAEGIAKRCKPWTPPAWE